jgi:hypothetical protein
VNKHGPPGSAIEIGRRRDDSAVCASITRFDFAAL